MSNQAETQMSQNILLWVKNLPAGPTNQADKLFIEAQRVKVISSVDLANTLIAQAKMLRDEAYLESLNLESYARRHWSDEEIQVTKQMSS